MGSQFTCAVQVSPYRLQLAVGGNDRRQLPEPTADFARIGSIAVQSGIGQLALELGVFGQQRVNRLHALRHASPSKPSRLPTYPNAKRRPSCAVSATVRASLVLLIGRSLFVGAGLALAVAPLETSDPTAAVENLLLAGVERVALRADLDHDVAASFGAAGLEGVATAADHGGLAVCRMNTRFHDVLFYRRSPGRPNEHEADVNRNRNFGC